LPEVVIRPNRGWRALDLNEIWARRDLVTLLAWRDVKVRYQQTAFGIAWAVIPTIATMIVFTVIFGNVVRIPTGEQPYWAFALCGLTLWGYFSQAFSAVVNSATNNSSLIEKVYFPRLVLPISAALPPLVDLAIGTMLLIGVLMITGLLGVGAQLVMIVPAVVLALGSALGLGSFLAALNVRYRDVRLLVPLTLQLMLFATPIVYPSAILPPFWRAALGVNPMAGPVELFRWAMLGGALELPLILVSAASGCVLLVGGLMTFRRLERSFADVI
jgi:lipopolysaccharide transport system permease protein